MELIKLKVGNKGFTLIELMMVIALIGVITVIAYPSFKAARRDNSLYSEARKLMVDIRYMQQLAFDAQGNYSLIFDSEGKSYSITTQKTTVKTVYFENSVYCDVASAIPVIQLGPNGLPIDGGGTIKLKLKNDLIFIVVRPGGKVEVLWNAP